ncbi:hypothetical protein [Flavobacterium alkalisoli]|uniref:hypothetical protein n=1 Tax=Flavobacterium alkalisoli TaxID=2602769 RepID=UPI003A903CAC
MQNSQEDKNPSRDEIQKVFIEIKASKLEERVDVFFNTNNPEDILTNLLERRATNIADFIIQQLTEASEEYIKEIKVDEPDTVEYLAIKSMMSEQTPVSHIVKFFDFLRQYDLVQKYVTEMYLYLGTSSVCEGEEIIGHIDWNNIQANIDWKKANDAWEAY